MITGRRPCTCGYYRKGQFCYLLANPNVLVVLTKNFSFFNSWWTQVDLIMATKQSSSSLNANDTVMLKGKCWLMVGSMNCVMWQRVLTTFRNSSACSLTSVSEQLSISTNLWTTSRDSARQFLRCILFVIYIVVCRLCFIGHVCKYISVASSSISNIDWL